MSSFQIPRSPFIHSALCRKTKEDEKGLAWFSNEKRIGFFLIFFVSLFFLSVAAERYALLLLLLSLLSPFLFTKRESTVYITIRALFHIHKSPDVFISVGRTHSTPLRLVDFNCFFFFFSFFVYVHLVAQSRMSEYRGRNIGEDPSELTIQLGRKWGFVVFVIICRGSLECHGASEHRCPSGKLKEGIR